MKRYLVDIETENVDGDLKGKVLFLRNIREMERLSLSQYPKLGNTPYILPFSIGFTNYSYITQLRHKCGR
jgi:hypothetical protein